MLTEPQTNRPWAPSVDIFETENELVVKADLTDPMSGFFMIRREAFDEAARNLSGQGYKILLDIVASAPRNLKIAELPFTFGLREHGESKQGLSGSTN